VRRARPPHADDVTGDVRRALDRDHALRCFPAGVRGKAAAPAPGQRYRPHHDPLNFLFASGGATIAGTVARWMAPLLVLGAGLMVAPLSPAAPRTGGTFRVAIPAQYVGSIDGTFGADPLLIPTVCASLMHLSDKPLPAGFRVAPELAARFPKVSADGRTYVFTMRKDAYFSTGAPVTAADVAYTIERVLNPVLKSPLASDFQPIVGAQAVLDGKATSVSGLAAAGRTLTIRLTRRVGDFLEGPAASLCVLPAGLPIEAQGVTAPVPSAAPYYVSEYLPGQQIVLERNAYYQGPRPQHVDRIVFDLTVDDIKAVDDVLAGTADFAIEPSILQSQRAAELARRFGINKSRFFIEPSNFLRMLVLNTSRPLLRDNVPLRQAINYAIERTALSRTYGGRYGETPVDQYLPPIMPGFTDGHVYPLAKPNLAKARALAAGHTRSGKLVLYIPSTTPSAPAIAQILKQDLARIGLTVEIHAFPAPLFFHKLATPGEPFDMGLIGWGFEPDPGAALNGLFDGALLGKPGNSNYSYFNSPQWNRALRQADRLTGEARYRSYGKLDIVLARDAAPAVAFGVDNVFTLVSARTGCIVANPGLDLAAVCLKP
jgi:peptide/nickel transport system substrate-binding protein